MSTLPPRRERDALGRLLPPGTKGVDGPQSRHDRTPEETLAEAQRYFDHGQPFAAHEVFEDAWKSGRADERDLWQGLAQLAVGLTHERRGNQAGATALFARGVEKLARYEASPPYRIAISDLIAWAANGPHSVPRLCSQ